jgi:hypothetical protein
MSMRAFERLPSTGTGRQKLALFRKALWEEHYGLCGICGLPVSFADMHIDHVVPVSLGGDDDWDNLQPSHMPCNVAKGGRNRGPVPLPNAPRIAIGERPVVDDATLQAWIGDPAPAPFMVRGIDPELWHRLRVEALKRKLPVGALLNEILREWLARLESDRAT